MYLRELMRRLIDDERDAALYALRSSVQHQVLPPSQHDALKRALAKLEVPLPKRTPLEREAVRAAVRAFEQLVKAHPLLVVLEPIVREWANQE